MTIEFDGSTGELLAELALPRNAIVKREDEWKAERYWRFSDRRLAARQEIVSCGKRKLLARASISRQD